MSEFYNVCKNCEEKIEESHKFCYNCGQKTGTHRINFHFLIHELQHGLFHVDKGILYTIKMLFTRPGKMLNEYLEGKRKDHFKPVLLVAILGSIYSLLNYFIPDDTFEIDREEDDFETQKILQNPEITKIVDILQDILSWFSEHLAILILIIIPITALAFFLGFKKYKKNYSEWLVIMTFLAGQALVAFIVIEVISNLTGWEMSVMFLLSIFILNVWTFLQFFNKENRFKIFLRIIWSQILTCIFTLLYLTLISSIIVIFLFKKYISEDTLKQLKEADKIEFQVK